MRVENHKLSSLKTESFFFLICSFANLSRSIVCDIMRCLFECSQVTSVMFLDIKRLRNDFYCIANAFNENRRLIFKYEKEISLNESEVESSNQARVEKQTEIVC